MVRAVGESTVRCSARRRGRRVPRRCHRACMTLAGLGFPSRVPPARRADPAASGRAAPPPCRSGTPRADNVPLPATTPSEPTAPAHGRDGDTNMGTAAGGSRTVRMPWQRAPSGSVSSLSSLSSPSCRSVSAPSHGVRPRRHPTPERLPRTSGPRPWRSRRPVSRVRCPPPATVRRWRRTRAVAPRRRPRRVSGRGSGCAAVPAGHRPSTSSSRRSRMTYARSTAASPAPESGPADAAGEQPPGAAAVPCGGRTLPRAVSCPVVRSRWLTRSDNGARNTRRSAGRTGEEPLHARSRLPRIPSADSGRRSAHNGIGPSQTASARGRRERLAVLMPAWAPPRSGPVEAVAPLRRYHAAGCRTLGRSSNAPVTRSS